MDATTATLPTDWTTVLDNVQNQLDHSLGQIDRRLKDLGEPRKTERQDSFTAPLRKLAERLEGLDKQTTKAQTFIADIDRSLAASEDLLREQLARSESLRRRLAEWVSRAIG